MESDNKLLWKVLVTLLTNRWRQFASLRHGYSIRYLLLMDIGKCAELWWRFLVSENIFVLSLLSFVRVSTYMVHSAKDTFRNEGDFWRNFVTFEIVCEWEMQVFAFFGNFLSTLQCFSIGRVVYSLQQKQEIRELTFLIAVLYF